MTLFCFYSVALAVTLSVALAFTLSEQTPTTSQRRISCMWCLVSGPVTWAKITAEVCMNKQLKCHSVILPLWRMLGVALNTSAQLAEERVGSGV